MYKAIVYLLRSFCSAHTNSCWHCMSSLESAPTLCDVCVHWPVSTLAFSPQVCVEGEPTLAEPKVAKAILPSDSITFLEREQTWQMLEPTNFLGLGSNRTTWLACNITASLRRVCALSQPCVCSIGIDRKRRRS